jgi:hypothetical protein
MRLLATTIWENRPEKFEKRQEWGASIPGFHPTILGLCSAKVGLCASTDYTSSGGPTISMLYFLAKAVALAT